MGAGRGGSRRRRGTRVRVARRRGLPAVPWWLPYRARAAWRLADLLGLPPVGGP